MGYEWHRPIEKKWLSLSVYTLLTVAIGGLVLLVPPFFLQGTIDPIEGLRPYSALELEGRDLYVREGCNTCHSQQVRPFKSETDRYGSFSTAGEGIYDRPFLFGSRRTGPDLARVGGKYPSSWHWFHFENARNLESRSNMPTFAFLSKREVDLSLTSAKLATLRRLGHPYSDQEIANAAADALVQAATVASSLRGDGIELSESQSRSETIALIAYLQKLGTVIQEAPVRPVALAGER